MDEIELLNSVLDKTADVVAGVSESDWDKPTPCSEYTVKDLVGHMVGWSSSFVAAANGRKPEGDPSAYQASNASAADFRAAVESITEGWQTNGTNREVSLIGAGPLPAQMVLDMTMMEYLAHGWDLAKATGQTMPYTDEEAQAILDLAQQNLPVEYRGDGKPFGEIVDVPIAAPVLEQFAGFMGRMP
jgi:uncharacterized protein (TIGR03086 family)